jgi:hypothetical protein
MSNNDCFDGKKNGLLIVCKVRVREQQVARAAEGRLERTESFTASRDEYDTNKISNFDVFQRCSNKFICREDR